MKISRLEVFGFKSFMDRLIFPLEDGITGIVGPNGCGKSNIVDAIRWVLGETRAKNLRGSSLEDVIFSGTDKFRPLGIAEVTLTLKSDDKEYFSNLTSSYEEAENLEQAIVTEIENEADTEPEASEDKYEKQENTPNLKLINLEKETEANKEKISLEVTTQSPAGHFAWLNDVSEVQVTRRLYRSGESEFFINRVKCRLKDIKELFNAVGLGAKGFTIIAQGKVGEIVSAKPEERRKILEEAAGVQGFRDRISAADRRLSETGINISRLDDIIKEVGRSVNSLKRQSNKAKNRKQLKEDILELEKKVFAYKFLKLVKRSENNDSDLKNFIPKKEELQNTLTSKKTIEVSARSELMNVDVQGDSLRTKIDSIRDELSRSESKKSNIKSRVKELSAFILAKETEIKRFQERFNTLDSREEASKSEIGKIENQEDALSKELTNYDNADETLLKDLGLKISKTKTDLRNAQNDYRTLRDKYISTESRLKALKSQLKSASPIDSLRKSSLDVDTDSKMLIDGIRVDSKYETALQAVLLEKAAFIVSSNFSELTTKVSNLQKDVSVGVFKKGDCSLSKDSSIAFKSLAEIVTCDNGFSLAVNNILKNIYFIQTATEAFDYFKDNNTDIQLVTEKGEIITKDSYYIFPQDSGLVQVKNLVDSLTSEYENLDSKVKESDEKISSLKTNLNTFESDYNKALKEIRENQHKIRELGNKIGNLKGRLHAEKRSLERLDVDRKRVNEQKLDNLNKISEFKKEIASLEEDLKNMDNSNEEKLKSELLNLDKEYKSLDIIRSEKREILSNISSDLDNIRSEFDSFASKISSAELESEKVKLEKNSLFERITDEYGGNLLADFKSYTNEDEFDFNNATTDLNKFKQRIVREGDIDPESIQRFEEENERLESLTNQKNDLTTASKTLTETLEKLRDTSREKFIQTFEKVSSNFSELVPRLFGGGLGRLELTNPENPLESGLNIIARPPGKKLKNIELLSGGEKALCAEALIIAMFLERPSPLCILDEVDAPLDDANLVRFLSLIKEMSTKTQFLMITHNKQSMSVADNLVGVTMEQPGVSKILSVSLNEAVEQVVSNG